MNEVEDTRLKEFRQFKKEIRGSKDHWIIGIDVAKEKHLHRATTAGGRSGFLFLPSSIFHLTQV